MDNRAIGVFDSGLGGLTTVRSCASCCRTNGSSISATPGGSPTGTAAVRRSRKYAMQDIRFLKRHEVKLVIAACGTVSSALTPELSAEAGVPFSGVVVPAAQAACAATVNGRIGVIGTTATVRSGAYGRAIRTINPDARTFGNACPLFVPLVETALSSRTTRSPRRSRKSTSSP